MKRENIKKAYVTIDQMRTLQKMVNRLQEKGVYLCSDNTLIHLSEKAIEVIRRYALEDIESELLRLTAELEAL